MIRNHRHWFWLAMLFCGTAYAETNKLSASFSSGEQQVALLELYTSEGCNSCPPADLWLSQLKSDPRLWKDYVPLALHVDYWDYIGWRDRFARAEFSQRQRQYVAEGGVRFPYTPGFFNNGEEWLGWRSKGAIRSDHTKVGNLAVLVDDDNVAVQFIPADTATRALSAHVAVLGMNLSSRVRAGENKGKELRHDFVVLGITQVPLQSARGAYKAAMKLPTTIQPAAELAIVVWVSASDRQAPIQATGGYLTAQ